ncbi:MAG TPA: hypothetical protein G4N94_13595, partial [Caldilineae bacterium]|nr:hypothetical protein [Caldilineae bacterium]
EYICRPAASLVPAPDGLDPSIADLRKIQPDWLPGAKYAVRPAGQGRDQVGHRATHEAGGAPPTHELTEQAAVKGRIVLMVGEA